LIRSGASGLPYYCTLVCVPAVLGGLAVWQNNNNQVKKKVTGRISQTLGLQYPRNLTFTYPLHTIKFIPDSDMLFPYSYQNSIP